jgi:hypothetical protein
VTVRVIQEAPAPEVEKRVTCKNCGRVLAYVPNDVLSYNGRDYSGGPDGCEWVPCPCGKKAIISLW